MLDLVKWKSDDRNDADQLKSALISKSEKKQSISILDLVPTLKEILKGKTYALWLPPGSSDVAQVVHRVANIGTVLMTNPSPQVIIVPLNVFRSRHSFKSCYGLINGFTYEMFLEAIKVGRICPVLCESPEYYTSGFYQDIFNACNECPVL